MEKELIADLQVVSCDLCKRVKLYDRLRANEKDGLLKELYNIRIEEMGNIMLKLDSLIKKHEAVNQEKTA